MTRRARVLVKPPKSAQKAARAALNLRARLPASRRGGLEPFEAAQLGITSGVAQARRIAAGHGVDARQVAAFFARHAGNVMRARLEGKSAAESKAIQAWQLWGGDTMRRAAMAAAAQASA